MMYVGGKARISKDIAEIISKSGCNTLVSLFCGGCAIEAKVTGFDTLILNDKHPYLIAMWKSLQQGYILPTQINEKQYKYISEHKGDDPALTGFVGFCCSFGGKWFGGYARDRSGKRNFAMNGRRTIYRDLPHLQTATFMCKDYRDVDIPQGAVIYADPPYNNTTGYSCEKFDSEAFWQYMRELALKGHKVYISEQTAPNDFIAIWEKPIRRTLNVNINNRLMVTEKLFTYKK